MKCCVFIITGAAGIAAETVKLLAGKGHRVFFVSCDARHCETLADELQVMQLQADFITGDLTDERVVKKLVSACVEKYGRIDGLFNVAGISGRKFGDGPLHTCSIEGWQTTLNNNLTTQFQMCKYVLNQMLAQVPDENGMRGVILNMASVLAFSPDAKNFNAIAYATSKGAIISMTKSAAAFYAKDRIRINAIAPGLALTNMSARAAGNDSIVQFMEEKQPLAGTVMSAGDIARSAVFLLGADAGMITGQTLTVDAGWSIS
ncbi:SDR family NAD(P)-dependent oxidoreductase [Chitinophaga rhizosphaerae]|uniref:SDR family NAD(P)-dependent oxidoreductase n=1 Tax=Chitinophaga rhizosphaerae TaxID=1864947 RepID=UPI000F812858|nr:SDR family oxidoreductase [Chitinophaga rhizosphaerae]